MQCTTYCIDEGNPVEILYFDLGKVFDKISHKRLMQKLYQYGSDGVLHG